MSSYDIVLITIDSLRADSVGFLDPDAPSTPNMDAFADDATLTAAATTPSSHTRASVPAILTSQYAHRFFTNFLQDIETPTIAQRLSDVGYSTAAFHSNPLLSRHFGYERGFDEFSDGLRFFEETQLPEKATRLYSKVVRLLQRYPYQPAQTITQQAVDWLASNDDDSPLFLWVHYMDPHGPYALDRNRGYLDKFQSERLWHKAVSEPEAVTNDELARLRAGYRGEIEHTDQKLEPLFDAINRYTDDACVVLTGDHGEEFREHGEFTHMPKLYEEVTRVPFVLNIPEVEDLSAPDPITLLDVLPTLLDHVDGAEVNPSVGINLVAPANDREYVVAETNPDDGGAIVGIRGNRYKYISDGTERELYDLVNDPSEQKNMAGSGHDGEELLERTLQEHLEEYRFDGGDKLNATAGKMDSEMQGRLEDLGYL
ncbi:MULTISPECIES: sulfatase [Haloarcula]|uniref:sulfatase n=1 Tax=Haloarcula TaxID=2237 RepID=UPI000F8DA57C|nr:MULTISPECIES: sulfatase [Haloarcula]NHX41498.1 sulfatase-like hydrolase/transferase [Haloarcula sp. R1-2]